MSSLLNWGIPPLAAMIFAGYTASSVQLQASLGYSRVWCNCIALMPCRGMLAYCNCVIPGCVGARHADRIPRCLQRGIVFSLLFLSPVFVLQFFAHPIAQGLGMLEVSARDVGRFCRLMIVTSALTVLDGHIESF